MDFVRQKRHTMALLVKISVITGWSNPEDEIVRNVLIDQFRKLLMEKYPTCNPYEVEYAFRQFGTTVKDWGKQMNLALIDEVMIPYLNQRSEISKLEEAHKVARLQYKPMGGTSDEDMEQWLQDTKDQNLSVQFLPVMLYDWLEKKGRIAPIKKEKWEYMQMAIAYRQSKLSEAFTDQMNMENRNALSEFMKMKESGEYEPEEAEKLRSLAKKMILYNYLKTI